MFQNNRKQLFGEAAVDKQHVGGRVVCLTVGAAGWADGGVEEGGCWMGVWKMVIVSLAVGLWLEGGEWWNEVMCGGRQFKV